MVGMKVKILEEVVELATRVGYVFIATADTDCCPHVAAAGRLALASGRQVVVTEWFCPGTIANLQLNPRLSLVVWDSIADVGYQLNGEVAEIKDVGILDGYAPSVETKLLIPQVERRLLVDIDRVTEFKRAPHSDIEEQ